ncbi:MAG: class I SAM-dependent methyltransferase [Solirubrobacteraceae bacterium]
MSEPTGAAAPSSLHPLVSGFSDAETYDRGRPLYGEEVVEELLRGLELPAGAPALELGAGTGQLSRALLGAGLELRALEPLEATRELLGRAIGPERVLSGVAERIPLPQDSVRAVFAADSFHWFDERRAMPEIRRVLRPGGSVTILRTIPVLPEDWSGELGRILTEMRPEHPAFTDRPAAAALEEDDAFGAVTELTLHGEQTIDRARVLTYLASMSWVGRLSREQRSELLRRAESLLERHGVGELRHELRHQTWSARLLAP